MSIGFGIRSLPQVCMCTCVNLHICKSLSTHCENATKCHIFGKYKRKPACKVENVVALSLVPVFQARPVGSDDAHNSAFPCSGSTCMRV